MKKTTLIIGGGIILIVVILLIIVWYPRSGTHDVVSIPSDSISDGVITIPYSSDTFALAVNREQILVTSYIPPCSEFFSYCFYYHGNQYAGTNFESAGLRISKRTDLSSEQVCLNTPPLGYEAPFAVTASSSDQASASSLFAHIGDAATGHYSESNLYRLYLRDKFLCYEFETRIGQSRFENYPEGSIREFTSSDDAAVQAMLEHLVLSITLPDGKTVHLPRL